MLLLGVATAMATATATTTPRMLVQFGPSRTATTFQFQSICAAALLLSRRGDQPPEDQVRFTSAGFILANPSRAIGH